MKARHTGERERDRYIYIERERKDKQTKGKHGGTCTLLEATALAHYHGRDVKFSGAPQSGRHPRMANNHWHRSGDQALTDV